MNLTFRISLLCGLALAGCETAHDVAVSSFRVIDAPANYVRRHIGPRETTTTTTTVQSDRVEGGRPVSVSPTPSRSSRQTSAQNRPGATPARSPHAAATSTTTTARTSASASPRSVAAQQNSFPTARPVPGKPGYVYSLDANGGYVDVSGYKTGDKAKDPYTQKVFIVP